MNPAPARFRDIPAALLLTLALAVASQRLVATAWTADLGIPFLLILAGTVLGLSLGISRFRRGMVFLLALIYSLVVIPFLAAAFLYPGVPWLERMISMGGRLAHSLGVLASGAPLEDPFLILAFFSFGFWILGLFSGYSLTRSSSFSGAVIPGGVVLILLQVFDTRGDKGVIFTALYLFLALLLLGRMNFALRRESWQAWRVFSTGEARANINLTVLAVAFFLVLTAWLLPVSPRPMPVLHEWWLGLTNLWGNNENLTNVIAGLETESDVPINEFYGRNLFLGQDAATSDTVYFRIETPGVGGNERYYWRVRSYDQYINGHWENSSVNERSFTPHTRSLQLPDAVGLYAEFTFKVLDTNAGSLVTPARPVWVSRPARLTYIPVGDEVVEPILFRANEPVRPGEEYLVHAVLSAPTVKQMRLAGTEYPDWVREHYLQLPAGLPPAIAEFASELTAGADTPYDRAAAITAYLRDEITYSTHVPPAPEGRDPLAWFLFDYKQGFCNYYATAEVVLLRSVGIPARLAVGFGQGEYDSPGWYTVRQRDAHAWPEVFFPALGWVEFEPTASEPELIWPSGEESVPPIPTRLPLTPLPGVTPDLPAELDVVPGQGDAGIGPGDGQNTLVVLLVFFALIILVSAGLAWAYISGALEKGFRYLRSTFNAPGSILARNWLEKNALPVPAWLAQRAWFAGLSPVARAFMSIFRALRLLKIPVSPSCTPAEAASTLLSRLPQAGEDIATLLEEYLPAVYGTAPGSLERIRSAAQSLRLKSRHARWEGWLKRISIQRSRA